MDIYLEAVAPESQLVDVGRYRSPVVPRIGEIILLRLDRMPGKTPYPNVLRFHVKDVRYGANNTMQTEEWITPYEIESESVTIEVEAGDLYSIEYLVRLEDKSYEEQS